MQRLRHLLMASAVLLSVLETDPVWAQAHVARVGILTITDTQNWYEPFYRMLREQGWAEGKNVSFEYRSTQDPSRYSQLAAELVRSNVDVILAVGPLAVRESFAATKTIPIVAHDLENDPVAVGYIASYAQPGGNLTGVFLDAPELAGKWFQSLSAVVPNLSRVLVLWDPGSGPVHLNAVRAIAKSAGIRLDVLEVARPVDIARVLSTAGRRSQALLILPSPMMYQESGQLAALAKKRRLPAISMFRPFAEAGGLLAYGVDMRSSAERCAALVAKLLAGAQPSTLAAERVSKFEFVLNRNTAKQLGVTTPDTLLLSADRTIN